MRINTNRRGGFTLVEIMIVVAIIGLLAAIAIPNFVKARKTAQGNACIANMRQIDAAIQQYAMENNIADDGAVTTENIVPYLRDGMPTCPMGNKPYVLPGTVSASVTCQNADADVKPKHILGPQP
jgi:prepilin-type N-terminal cleavage/methylation domain-containing protein